MSLNLTLHYATQDAKSSEAAQVGRAMRAVKNDFPFYDYDRTLGVVAEYLSLPVSYVRFIWIGCNAGSDSL